MSSPALIQHVAERAVAHLKDCFDNALDILTYCPACGKPMCESTVHLVDLQPTEVLAFSICGPCDDRSRAGKPLKAHSKWLSSAPAYLIECDPLIAQAVYALSGDWQDHRDCHLKPDLVLIYRKPDDAELQLVRLGSHSELGL